MSETDVNSSEVNEEAGDKAKTYTEEQFKGLLADKQAEVKKRQDLEKQVENLTAKQTQDPPSGTNEGESEDAPMTVGQFRSMLAEQKESDSNAVFTALEAETSAIAKQKMTAESCGEGLDFDSVIAAGNANLSEGDKLAIRQSKDPAAEKYRRCVFNTPELSEKVETVRTSKLLEEIKLTGRVPASGSVETGVTTDDIGKMSEKQLDQLAESLE
jgi:hypothetical protein